ncbi:MAG: endonuclease/exonuclease/phosphatase family protein [Polyangiaceae bacterium]|nr:endonuclease/exonuclease/phosphatase family protein [Polyangiaceae bacterium]
MRLATYNVRLLCLAGRGGRHPKSRRSWRAVAQVIDLLQADVLALQEVGSPEALVELQSLLAAPYPHAHFCPTNSRLGIHLAVLSRRPIDVASHRDVLLRCPDGEPLHDHPNREAAREGQLSPLRFQRDLPRVSLEGEGGGFARVFVAHLKSLRSYPWMRHTAGAIRSAEARAAAHLMQQHLHEPCVLLGDFNAPPRDVSLAPLCASEHWWDPIAAEQEPSGALVPTYRSGVHSNRIDFALLSPKARSHYQPGSARIHTEGPTALASDHLPLSVELAL